MTGSLAFRVAVALALAAPSAVAAPASVPSKPGTIHVLWEQVLPSEENGDRQVAVIGSRVFADAGSVLESLDLDRGTVRWRRDGVQVFHVGGQKVFAGSAGSVIALEANGRVLWERPACIGRQIAKDLALLGSRIVALCAWPNLTAPRGGRGSFVALDARSGAFLYRSRLVDDASPERIEVAGPSLLVKAFFSGAYDGEDSEFFDPVSGRPIASFVNHDVVATRGNRVLLDDHLIFDVGDAYEPALLSWLDVTTGQQTKRVPLSPPERYRIVNGHPEFASGLEFVAGDWLYLKLGPMLYRYRLPDFRRREIVMTDAGELYYYGPNAAVLAVAGHPKNRLVELFLSDSKIVTLPLAELDTPIDFKRESLATSDSLFMVDNGGRPILVDAEDGRVYNGADASADVRIGARRALTLLNLYFPDGVHFKGAALRSYELRNP